ncbi:MAG: type II secretion system F family protein [Thaumarchaeota archaeon]|nr:type II secretion system F family protein [Nitrososphaerota archaeon]MCL5067978.1 type II secretion system F family protein [Nitrososphaerota archaeon]
MRYINDQWQYAAYTGAAIIAIFSIILGLSLGRYQFVSRYLVPVGSATRSDGSAWTLFNRPWLLPQGPSASLTDTIVGIGVICALIPIVYISWNNYRYIQTVERNIPRFMNDILQSTDSGMILPAALIEASKEDYGPLSYEIGVAMTKFTMGYDFRASIMEAARRLRHPRMPQVGLIIVEAYVSGGKMHDVLASSVQLFSGLEEYEEEKKAELKPYTQLVYISIVIFLVIALIIVSQFIEPLNKIPTPSQTGGLVGSNGFSVSLSEIPPIFFASIFFIAGIFEGLFGGIVAGKIVEGSSTVGLRHSLLLVAITIIVFNAPVIGIFGLV